MKVKKNGISLIVLIITIVVIIVLAVAIVLTLNKNNPIESANKAVFLSDLKNYQEKLTLVVADKMLVDKTESVKELTPKQTNELLETSDKWRDKLIVREYRLKLVDGKFSTDEMKLAKDKLGIDTEYIDIPLDGIVMATEPKLGIDKYTNSTNVTITLSDFPSDSRVDPEYKIDNEDWIKYTVPFTVSKNCVIQVRVEKDKNTAMFSIENIDRTKPTKLILTGNTSYAKDATITLKSEDIASAEYASSGIKEIKYKWLTTNTLLTPSDFIQPLKDTQKSVLSTNENFALLAQDSLSQSAENNTQIQVPEGNNYLHTMVIDNAGNYEIEVSSNSYKVDKTAPTIGNMTTSDLTTTSVKATINNAIDSGSGIKEYEFYVDGTLKVKQASNVYVYSELTTGKAYNLSYKVIDNVGNTTSMSTNVAVTLSSLDYVKTGLMLWYDGINNVSASNHNNNATTWYDLSGNGKNGTLINCVWENNALVFNGSNSWVRIGAMNYSKITLQAVYMLNKLGSDNDVISNFSGGGYGLSNYGTSHWKFMIYISGKGYVNLPATTGVVPNVVINKKYSLSGSYDGSTIKYMQNGQIISQGYSGVIGTTGSNTVLALGTNPSGSDPSISYLNGRIYSIRVYNRALTDAELQQNYQVDKQRFGL